VGSTPLAILGFCAVYWPLRRKVARMQVERRTKLDARRTAIRALQPEQAII
jgi:hypothetical protein